MAFFTRIVHEINMMTSSNENIFHDTGHLCGEFSGHRWIPLPSQRPVTRSINIFFDLRLNKRLNKQPWGWWFGRHRAHYDVTIMTWWRHQMETFSALLSICAGNSPVPGEFPTQRPVTRSFDIYFHLRPDTRLSKQSRGWWFETLSHSLWRHCNESVTCQCLDIPFWN